MTDEVNFSSWTTGFDDSNYFNSSYLSDKANLFPSEVGMDQTHMAVKRVRKEGPERHVLVK